jgi:stress-induced morphogen
MSRRPPTTPASPQVQRVLDVLRTYKDDHPLAEIDAYRQNSASIRIRVIDPDFQGMDRVARHDTIWKILELLPEDIVSQITVLLPLTPDEREASFANMDFENPIPSRL